jgi:hypothetical protein
MQMAGAPVGNQNGLKKHRLLTDALRRELTQNPEEALKITRKLIDCAKDGEAWAQVLVHDRCDGKLPTPVVGDEDGPPILFEGTVRFVGPGQAT